MIRALLCLALLLSASQARAETAEGFDAHMAQQVYTAALAFMAPRILEPVPVPQLTSWGLQGLSALDPRLMVETHEDGMRLSAGNRLLLSLAPPPASDLPAWGQAAADKSAAAWDASPALRRAGQTGLVNSFFDEVFNHLDPYSRYEPPDEAGADRGSRNGDAGLGLTLAVRGKAVVVRDLVADGPGYEGGLRPGDRIEAVDDEPTRGRTLAAVADAIAGPEGTVVTLSWRSKDGRLRTADFERDLVPPESVFAERAGPLLLLRVASFNSRTAERFADRLADGLEPLGPGVKPPSGIVIDLRGNRGGLVREAAETAALLLPDGIVAQTVGRDPAADHVWRSSGTPLAAGLPLVVLVDGRTASAAEILAAALADRGRAVVVGSATLGKGLVQIIDRLPDGGELFVTWSRVLAPRNWPIQGLGVLPQLCTSLGQEATDRQLRDLSDGLAPMELPIQRHHQARPPLPPPLVVSLRDACPAAVGREADLAAARWLIDHPPAYETALLPPTP
jgi:carboxyl-terminal processing protease